MKCYQPMNITTTLTAKGNSYLKLNLNCIKGQLEREWHCSTLVPLQHLRETGETHPRGGFITWGAEHRLHFTPVHPLSKTSFWYPTASVIQPTYTCSAMRALQLTRQDFPSLDSSHGNHVLPKTHSLVFSGSHMELFHFHLNMKSFSYWKAT